MKKKNQLYFFCVSERFYMCLTTCVSNEHTCSWNFRINDNKNEKFKLNYVLTWTDTNHWCGGLCGFFYFVLSFFLFWFSVPSVLSNQSIRLFCYTSFFSLSYSLYQFINNVSAINLWPFRSEKFGSMKRIICELEIIFIYFFFNLIHS